MAEENELAKAIIDLVEKHGKCTVVSHPDDADLIDLLRNMPGSREALDLATMAGLIEWKQDASLKRREVQTFAWSKDLDIDRGFGGGTHG